MYNEYHFLKLVELFHNIQIFGAELNESIIINRYQVTLGIVLSLKEVILEMNTLCKFQKTCEDK